MTTDISNQDDTIDSRDVLARIEELEAVRADELAEAHIAELTALKKLADEASPYAPDWHHGCTLIRDSYFADYARDLAEDITQYDSAKERWPYTCIDWEKAANELKQDYTSVDFDGVTYWVR